MKIIIKTEVMELIKKKFKECDRLFLEKTFELEQVGKHYLLTDWIEQSKKHEIDEMAVYCPAK